TVFQRSSVAWGHHLVDEAFKVPPETEDDPVKRYVSESSLRLTSDEALRLQQELNQVVARYRETGRQPSGEERDLYSVYQIVQPMPDLAGEPAPEAAT
ncbi:MAG TPA: transcriptional regulator, partial [Nocardioides sp.]